MITLSEESLNLGSQRRQEFLSLIQNLEPNSSPTLIRAYFETLAVWKEEHEEPTDLIDAVCKKLLLDNSTGQIYLRCPQLIPMMEPLRRGEPIRKLKITMSEEGRRWWYALLVMDVLKKCGGVISHVRLIRWLSHRVNGGQIRTTLELLREARLVETYQVKGNDPLRPVTWHRMLGVDP